MADWVKSCGCCDESNSMIIELNFYFCITPRECHNFFILYSHLNYSSQMLRVKMRVTVRAYHYYLYRWPSHSEDYATSLLTFLLFLFFLFLFFLCGQLPSEASTTSESKFWRNVLPFLHSSPPDAPHLPLLQTLNIHLRLLVEVVCFY